MTQILSEPLLLGSSTPVPPRSAFVEMTWDAHFSRFKVFKNKDTSTQVSQQLFLTGNITSWDGNMRGPGQECSTARDVQQRAWWILKDRSCPRRLPNASTTLHQHRLLFLCVFSQKGLQMHSVAKPCDEWQRMNEWHPNAWIQPLQPLTIHFSRPRLVCSIRWLVRSEPL